MNDASSSRVDGATIVPAMIAARSFASIAIFAGVTTLFVYVKSVSPTPPSFRPSVRCTGRGLRAAACWQTRNTPMSTRFTMLVRIFPGAIASWSESTPMTKAPLRCFT